MAQATTNAAVRVTFDYVVAGSTLERNGLAVGTLINGNLHLFTFVAPALYFFERDRPKVEAIIASATF